MKSQRAEQGSMEHRCILQIRSGAATEGSRCVRCKNLAKKDLNTQLQMRQCRCRDRSPSAWERRRAEAGQRWAHSGATLVKARRYWQSAAAGLEAPHMSQRRK